MFKAFDHDNDGYVSEDEWILGMSIFLKGTIEEQARCKLGFIAVAFLRPEGPGFSPGRIIPEVFSKQCQMLEEQTVYCSI